MICEFEHVLVRGDEEIGVLVEYSAISIFGEVDIDILSVTDEDGLDVETTHDEDKDLFRVCFERVDFDFEDDEASRGDYLRDMRMSDYD